jgi:hypothetical protein
MPTRFRNVSMLVLALLPALAACGQETSNTSDPASPAHKAAVASPCSGVWPSYWQDPAFDKAGMWEDQFVSNTPTTQNWAPGNPAYTNPPFQLADAYSAGKPDDPAAQTWRDSKFDPLFKPETSQADKTRLATEYGWRLMHYIQEGNIESGDPDTDWNLCANQQRQWFNMPFQTYDVQTGREFVHGLTREAPVAMSLSSQSAPLGTTVWAVAFYNGNAAPTLAGVWRPDGSVAMPINHLKFAEGTVVGKLLFTTATAANATFLSNMPTWTANTSMGAAGQSNPTFCAPAKPGETMQQVSERCKRSPSKVTLMQFDVAVRDSRATNGWVFGTFVADGEAKANEANPWNRISLLGLIWGDDTPPTGQLASTFPANPRANGFTQSVIAWDVADRLTKAGGSKPAQQPGHLGCNSRLNGPADNAASSCTSCHMTASVPDANNDVPPLLAQFSNTKITPQCAASSAPASGQVNNVTYAQMDSIYFAQTRCGTPFQTSVNGVCVFNPKISKQNWISTDFSVQMSTALLQWNVWQAHLAGKAVAGKAATGTRPMMAKIAPAATEQDRVFNDDLPLRGE